MPFRHMKFLQTMGFVSWMEHQPSFMKTHDLPGDLTSYTVLPVDHALLDM